MIGLLRRDLTGSKRAISVFLMLSFKKAPLTADHRKATTVLFNKLTDAPQIASDAVGRVVKVDEKDDVEGVRVALQTARAQETGSSSSRPQARSCCLLAFAG